MVCRWRLKYTIAMKDLALKISQLSTRHAPKGVILAIIVMSLLTLRRMGLEFNRLLWSNSELGAIDLHQRYREVLTWFSGETVYGAVHTAVYPPASYTMLWPLLGSGSFSFVRGLWAFSTLGALVALIYLVIREIQARGWLEYSFIALMVLSIYATGQTIGNGQLTLHVMLVLVAGGVCLRRATLPASVLMTVALIKPTLSLPFFWQTLWAANRVRLILLIGVQYFVLAAIAAHFQSGNLISLHADWLTTAAAGAAWGSSGGGGDTGDRATGLGVGVGYGNVHDWLGAIGWGHLNTPVSLAILFGLGYWTYHYRAVDMWIGLGVTAIVARLWTYHLVYDDLLILLPMITLFRLAKQSSMGWVRQQISGGLLAISLMAALVPASVRLRPPPWNGLFTGGQTVIWLLMLFFLVYLAEWYRRQNFVAKPKTLPQ